MPLFRIDDRFYGLVAQELKQGVMDEGLWVRILADVDGDESKVRARYIDARAQKLSNEERRSRREDVNSRNIELVRTVLYAVGVSVLMVVVAKLFNL